MSTTYGSLLRSLFRELTRANLPTPDLDARILLEHACGLSRTQLLARANDPAPEAIISAAQNALARRLAREPVARILGEWDFWTLTFKLNEATLIPRPETEHLVEWVLKLVRAADGPFVGTINRDGAGLTIADIGTGSGAILISILHELKSAHGIATDLSPLALAQARENAELNHVAERITFAQGDFLEPLTAPVHVIVSNPPYIASDVVDGLEPEVRDHDPRLALDGGPDGLMAYRRIIANAHHHLRPGGVILFEIGFDQADPLRQLGAQYGYTTEIRLDLNHLPRLAILTANR